MTGPADIFNVSRDDFDKLALEIFAFQFREIPVYREFCSYLGKTQDTVHAVRDIPFLPIQFFKSHRVCAPDSHAEVMFQSSGTTGEKSSNHFVSHLDVYRQSFIQGFSFFYGNPEQYCFLGLLPSYLERGNSSLVFMVDELIKKSVHPNSGFYLYDHEKLANLIAGNERSGQKTILIGVTYALLDFFQAHPQQLKHTIVMETGGMKGRRKEMVRAEVHQLLMKQTGLDCIHSEYGMTELLSQAYSSCNGIFRTAPWLKIILRSEDDPLETFSYQDLSSHARSGIINVIDLANMYSCSFIATEDLGRLYPDNSFEVLGRIDVSDMRGCNLLYTAGIK
jgi:hypothetical protein